MSNPLIPVPLQRTSSSEELNGIFAQPRPCPPPLNYKKVTMARTPSVPPGTPRSLFSPSPPPPVVSFSSTPNLDALSQKIARAFQDASVDSWNSSLALWQTLDPKELPECFTHFFALPTHESRHATLASRTTEVFMYISRFLPS